MNLIRGESSLDEFRRYWTGERMLSLLQSCGGRMRVEWAVGVGKSVSIDRTIEAATTSGAYDLVVALFPTRRVINERAWIQDPHARVCIVNLRPRPRKRCGAAQNESWQEFEKADLGALGRVEICGHCPRRRGCFWPKQYGKSLRGAQVVFGTQAHLTRSSSFILQLETWTKAARVLVLLDEANCIISSFRRKIRRGHLLNIVDVLKRLKTQRWKHHGRWLYVADLLLHAKTKDLQAPDWKLPRFYPKWALAVQALGLQLHGKQFRFLGYDLLQFGYSPIGSRERNPQGDILFAAPPYLNTDFIIYSGTASSKFAEFRLGKEFSTPFEDYRFEHPGTVWYNIASRLGTKGFFRKNAPQILDFFAGLISQRIREGRRVLLVAKKCFVPFCGQELTWRLQDLGLDTVRIVIGDWKTANLSDPLVVPLINYGMVGTNLFESSDCGYCLTSYYVTEEVVNSILQDVLASDLYIPLKITTEGRPRRRKAGVLHHEHRFFDIHHLAQLALDQQEMDVVLQGVGRVRPYTKPREIITFQCAAHPQLAYSKEFNSLGEAREFFGIPSRRERIEAKTRDRLEAFDWGGQSQAAIASQAGLSLSTIKRYAKRRMVSRVL